ncbi:hypothetical protein BD769DRAFT_1636660 [Suillus cothurnatus]|nr:hypothetical protein BD769DRAFT_1636660 [Suillus cothurnatus]
MSTVMNNSSATPRVVVVHHATHPERDNQFCTTALSSEFLKENQKTFRVQCTQCQASLEKLLKCAKCQKKHWPTHKPRCHEVERSSGAFKFVRMFILNPILMGLLKVVIDCGLINIDNPRIGFDVPFGVRIDIAIEPNNILDFIGLYFNNRSPGEKLQGMVQVKCHDTVGTYTGAECLAKDSVGLVDFVDVNYTKNSGNALTLEVHFPPIILDIAKAWEPFLGVSAVMGAEIRKPMSSMTCLETLDMHIRADKGIYALR